MAMFGSFEDFWAALNRLYESTLRLEETQQQHAEALVRIDERLDRLASMVATLAGTVAQLTMNVESHERRLQRMEGT